MATIFLDDFNGSGSVDGHAPAIGAGVWHHSDGYPPAATSLAGGQVQLGAGFNLVYVDFVGSQVLTDSTFVAEFDFIGLEGVDARAELVGQMTLVESDDVVLEVGAALYYSPGSSLYDPPLCTGYAYGPGSGGSAGIRPAIPSPGVQRQVRLTASNGSQSVELDGIPVYSGSASLPLSPKLRLTFKLLGAWALSRVTVQGQAAPLAWTRLVEAQER